MKTIFLRKSSWTTTIEERIIIINRVVTHPTDTECPFIITAVLSGWLILMISVLTRITFFRGVSLTTTSITLLSSIDSLTQMLLMTDLRMKSSKKIR
jgi:hypothetical protein